MYLSSAKKCKSLTKKYKSSINKNASHCSKIGNVLAYETTVQTPGHQNENMKNIS